MTTFKLNQFTYFMNYGFTPSLEELVTTRPFKTDSVEIDN